MAAFSSKSGISLIYLLIIAAFNIVQEVATKWRIA